MTISLRSGELTVFFLVSFFIYLFFTLFTFRVNYDVFKLERDWDVTIVFLIFFFYFYKKTLINLG